MSKEMWLITNKNNKTLIIIGGTPVRGSNGEWGVEGPYVGGSIDDQKVMWHLFGALSSDVRKELAKFPRPKPEDDALEIKLKVKGLYYESKCSKEN